MKKLLCRLTSFPSQVKLISLLAPLILFCSVTAQTQSLNQFAGQNQLDQKTNYPLIFLSPQAVTQQAATPLWESIQTIVVDQPVNRVGPNVFAKPVTLDLDQVRNGSADDPVDPPTAAPWVNGNAGASNAHYVEGYSIPYRVVIKNLVGNALRSVDIEWDVRQSNSSAIDFITNFDMIDYPANSHVFNFGHPKEVINPLSEEGGSYASGTSPLILAPAIPAAPLATFNAIQGTGDLGKFSIWNADINSMEYISEGNVAAASSSTRLRIFFTNSASTVIISWGGHIAKETDWGEGNSAISVSGSPYHTRLLQWDPDGDISNGYTSLGNQDRSLSADAVVDPPVCEIGGPSSVECSSTSTFTSGVAASDLSADMTFAWSLVDANGATFCSAPTVSTACVIAGSGCGTSFTVRYQLLKNDLVISTCEKAVSVTDTHAPTITCPSAPTSPIDCPTTPVFGEASATDNCGTPTVSSADNDVQGTCGYTRTRKWTARDACGNTATCSQSVTVRDVTSPVITNCPPDVVIECDANSSAASIGSATATDACSTPTVTSSDGTSSVGCITVITRTWTARDACGNTATCVQRITKRDRTAPVINCATNPVSATDNCPGTVTLFLSNGKWTAIDGSGNISTATCGAGSRINTSTVKEEQKEQQIVVEEKTAAPMAVKELAKNITVQAIPNPFNDRVRFIVTSPEAGYGSLDVMNMLGQKVKTVFQGQVNAGNQSFEMVLPQSRYSTLFYILRINGKQVTGKLVQAGNRN